MHDRGSPFMARIKPTGRTTNDIPHDNIGLILGPHLTHFCDGLVFVTASFFNDVACLSFCLALLTAATDAARRSLDFNIGRKPNF